MSFSGTPLGQGRRLDHHTFLNKTNPNNHINLPRAPASPPKDRPVPASYAYGAPTLGTRSPPKSGASISQEDNALARFARLKQRQQLSSSSSQTQTQTKTLEPTRWAVRDTSVQVANAFQQAATSSNPVVSTSYSQSQSYSDGPSNSSMNPTDAWASQGSRSTQQIPRSTSAEFEQQASTHGGRRFAEPPKRNGGPPPAKSTGTATRQAIPSNGSLTIIPDSEGEDELFRRRDPMTRGKSPIDTAVDIAKRAAFYLRQKPSDIPADDSVAQVEAYVNGNGHNPQESYDYSNEEREYQKEMEAQNQKSASQRRTAPGVHKRGRISVDNKAYKPTISDYEDSDGELSDDGKKRRKKKKKDLSGLSLPIMAGEKRKRRKSRGSKGDMQAGSDEEEGSESEHSHSRSVHSQPPTQVIEQQQSQQSQQRASVTRSLPPPSRASASRTSAPPEPLAQDDRSLEQAEQGQSSLDSVPEEVYEEYHEAPMVRPSHPYARRRGRAFSVGGLLGKLVHALYLFGVRSVTLFFWAISEFTRVVGKTLGMTLKPVTFVTDMPTTPLLKGAGWILALAMLWGAWNNMPSNLMDYVPHVSLPSRSSGHPAYQAPELPAANVAEISQRLLSLENALAGLSLETERTRASTSAKHNELLGQLGQIETQVQKENRRAIEAESQYSSAASQSLLLVRREIDSLQEALKSGEYTQEKTTVVEKIIESTGPSSDEEARAKLAALEERVNGVEGGVKEALEIGKTAVKAGGAAAGGAATWWQRSSSSANKGLTIKSGDGQDVTALIDHMVESAVSRRGRDGIAKPDFALNSGGASVIPALTSETLEIKVEGLKALLGLFTGYGGVIGRPPITALHHENHNGHCWPFEGSQGHLGVQLAHPAYVEEISIDHVAREVAWDLRSAPREMEVWGLIEGKANFEKVREWKVAKAAERLQKADEAGISTDSADVTVLDDEGEEYPDFLPRDMMFVRIASFEYDVRRDEEIQTFPVDEEVKALGIDFGVVVLSVKSNWGKEFTCLYRMRVHGQRMQDTLADSETTPTDAPEPEPTQAP